LVATRNQIRVGLNEIRVGLNEIRVGLNEIQVGEACALELERVRVGGAHAL
jgi:hypothetical protein